MYIIQLVHVILLQAYILRISLNSVLVLSIYIYKHKLGWAISSIWKIYSSKLGQPAVPILLKTRYYFFFARTKNDTTAKREIQECCKYWTKYYFYRKISAFKLCYIQYQGRTTVSDWREVTRSNRGKPSKPEAPVKIGPMVIVCLVGLTRNAIFSLVVKQWACPTNDYITYTVVNPVTMRRYYNKTNRLFWCRSNFGIEKRATAGGWCQTEEEKYTLHTRKYFVDEHAQARPIRNYLGQCLPLD